MAISTSGEPGTTRGPIGLETDQPGAASGPPNPPPARDAATPGSVPSDADAAANKKKKKGTKGDPAALFKKLDTDNDSKLSKEEFSKFGKDPDKSKQRAEKLFSKLDANSDGSISADELKKISELKGKTKKKKKGSDS